MSTNFVESINLVCSVSPGNLHVLGGRRGREHEGVYATPWAGCLEGGGRGAAMVKHNRDVNTLAYEGLLPILCGVPNFQIITLA